MRHAGPSKVHESYNFDCLAVSFESLLSFMCHGSMHPRQSGFRLSKAGNTAAQEATSACRTLLNERNMKEMLVDCQMAFQSMAGSTLLSRRTLSC